MTTGKNIRKHREARNWTLEDLSNRSGVDVGTISALENRDSSRSKFFGAIAKGFGLTIEELGMEPGAESQKLDADAERVATMYMSLSATRKAAAEQIVMGFMALEQSENNARLIEPENQEQAKKA